MVLMGAFLALVQIHRSGGGVLAVWLGSNRGYGPVELASIIGGLFLASALVQLPFGLLYDRFGPRITVSMMGLVAVGGIGLFAWAQSVNLLVLGRVLIGIGHGGVITAIYLLAIAWAPPQRVGAVVATVIALAGGLGAVLSTAPLAAALERGGFEATFTAVTALTLVVTVAILILVRDHPAEAGPVRTGPPETLRTGVRGLVEVARDRNLWPVFAMGACFAAPFLTLGALWVGPYLRDVHRLDPGPASYVLLAMVLSLHLGTFGYGALDGVVASRRRLILLGVTGMVVALVLLAAAPAAPLPLVVAALVTFSLCAPFYVSLANQCRGFVAADRAGRAISIMSLAGLGAVFVLQGTTGYLIEATAAADGEPSLLGYRLVFAAVAITLLMAAIAYSRSRDAPAPG